MSIADAIEQFAPIVDTLIGQYGYTDGPAYREAWNNFTDNLRSEGWITATQYEEWPHPERLLRSNGVYIVNPGAVD